MEIEETYFRDFAFPLPDFSPEEETDHFAHAWDPDDIRIKQFIQPELVSQIPHGRGGGGRRKRRSKGRIIIRNHAPLVTDAQELVDVTLNRFWIRLSPGEHYFYSIRPWYAESIIQAHLTIIGVTGITESRDRLRTYTTDDVRRTRRYVLYLTEEERSSISVCRGGAIRTLAAHARREDPEGVVARDLAAQREKATDTTASP